jgi:hypothetical protein
MVCIEQMARRIYDGLRSSIAPGFGGQFTCRKDSSIQLSLVFTNDCRRLAAAGGYPTATGDSAIQVSPPSDFAGFPSATATGVNVRVARITG